MIQFSHKTCPLRFFCPFLSSKAPFTIKTCRSRKNILILMCFLRLRTVSVDLLSIFVEKNTSLSFVFRHGFFPKTANIQEKRDCRAKRPFLQDTARSHDVFLKTYCLSRFFVEKCHKKENKKCVKQRKSMQISHFYSSMKKI